MHEKQMLQSCLAHCQTTVNDLRSLTNTVQNPNAKGTLSQASQSLDDCIKKCQDALAQV
jgi:hypothetical protein